MGAVAWLDKANTVTNNAATFLRDLIEEGVTDEAALAEKLRPLAEQFDGLFADGDNPIPDPPEGGVPTS